ncbi:MAG: hypothetical protein OXE05_09005 [Chloroflexi bacterium]|nr:hypothetical protein [Chloroflexota bacterium]
MSDETMQLEAEFREAMLGVYRTVAKIKAPPTRFLNMLEEYGAVETARQLLSKDELQETFIALYESGRLDASVEAVVLQPKYRELFTDAELQQAQDRLKSCGYDTSKTA